MVILLRELLYRLEFSRFPLFKKLEIPSDPRPGL